MASPHYFFPECAGKNCGGTIDDELSSCVQIALEFALDDGKSVFVRMADWHSKMEDGYIGSFMCRKQDGSIFLLAAAPNYLVARGGHDGKGVPTKTFDEVEEMVLNMHVQAIAERVYCYGMTYAATKGIKVEDRATLHGYGKGRRASAGPKMERFCVPKGVEILDCLTEDHLRRIRYMDSDDW